MFIYSFEQAKYVNMDINTRNSCIVDDNADIHIHKTIFSKMCFENHKIEQNEGWNNDLKNNIRMEYDEQTIYVLQ